MAYRRLHQAFKHLRFAAKSAPRLSRRARHAAASRSPAWLSPFACGVEPLERRVLLTTLTGGGIDPFTGAPLDGDTFDFRQGTGDTVVRVKLRGNITAELI